MVSRLLRLGLVVDARLRTAPVAMQQDAAERRLVLPLVELYLAVTVVASVVALRVVGELWRRGSASLVVVERLLWRPIALWSVAVVLLAVVLAVVARRCGFRSGPQLGPPEDARRCLVAVLALSRLPPLRHTWFHLAVAAHAWLYR